MSVCACVSPVKAKALRTRWWLPDLPSSPSQSACHACLWVTPPRFSDFQMTHNIHQLGSTFISRPEKIGMGCREEMDALGVVKIPPPGRGFLGEPVAQTRPREWLLWPVIISADNHDPKLRLLSGRASPPTDPTHCASDQGRGLPHPCQAEPVVRGVEETQADAGSQDSGESGGQSREGVP